MPPVSGRGMTERSSVHRRFPSDETIGYALGFLRVVTFGASLPATGMALEGYDPWFITFARAAIATLASVVVLGLRRRPLRREHALTLFVAGLLLCYGFPGLMAVALEHVPAGHGGIVLGILPLATAVFAAILGGERPSALFWGCGVAGTALVIVVRASRQRNRHGRRRRLADACRCLRQPWLCPVRQTGAGS